MFSGVKKIKRCYVELNVPVDSSDDIEPLLDEIFKNGFKVVFLTSSFIEKLKEIKKTYSGNGIFYRYEIKLSGRKNILRELRRSRRRVEIVSVACSKKDDIILAARDRRVDIISLNEENMRYFTDSVAKLLKGTLKIVEVPLSPIIERRGMDRVRYLRDARKVLKIALRRNVNIGLTLRPDDAMKVRSPKEIMSLASILDLSEDDARKAITENPINLLTENLRKLSSSYVMPGVETCKDN
ncbi:MAG: RNase P subunit p30 family protein [Candidatus Asgardarchaeia archaeon]